MSTLFNEENFLKKLENLSPTQDNIQSLGLWIIHHKAHYEAITRTWFKKLKELKEATNSKHVLSLFYLANDVIQNCKRKNAKIFQEAFKQHMLDAVVLIQNNETIKPNIERVFSVWKERNVYEKDYIDKLYELLSFKKIALKDEEINTKELEIQRLISEFQPKKLCDTISKFNSLEKDILNMKATIETSHLLDINMELIRQHRDKSQCAKFYNEFEASFAKLEEYIKYLEVQMNERQSLINLLEQSEIFYDAQYKDAKLVVDAYKGYGAKVHLVQKKLEEITDKQSQSSGNFTSSSTAIETHDVKLDNLDMEMSDDENNNDYLNENRSLIMKQQDSLIKGLPIPTITSSKSFLSTIRTNLDPRQGRINASNNSNQSLLYSPPNKAIKNSDCLTPIKDELEQNATKSPFDFLTRLLSNTASSAAISFSNNNHTNNHSLNTSNSNSSNNNIISSLQKYVCNSATTNSTFMNNNSNQIKSPIQSLKLGLNISDVASNAYDPREYNYEGYYNDDLYNDEDLMNDNHTQDTHMLPKRQRSIYDANPNIYVNQAITSQNQRSVTPTKDEIYQNVDTQYSHYQPTGMPQQTVIPSHVHLVPPPPPPPSQHQHNQMIAHNFIPSKPVTNFQQSLMPSNMYSNQLMQPNTQQISAASIQPSIQASQYMALPPPPTYPPQIPSLLSNYQKPLNSNSTSMINNKPSNNININTGDLNTKNDSLNEDSLKRKHTINDNRSNYEYPHGQQQQQQNNNFAKSQKSNFNTNNQKSYRIPTISSSYHRGDNNSNNNNNNLNNSKNFNTKYNQHPQTHYGSRANSYYNQKSQQHHNKY